MSPVGSIARGTGSPSTMTRRNAPGSVDATPADGFGVRATMNASPGAAVSGGRIRQFDGVKTLGNCADKVCVSSRTSMASALRLESGKRPSVNEAGAHQPSGTTPPAKASDWSSPFTVARRPVRRRQRPRASTLDTVRVGCTASAVSTIVGEATSISVPSAVGYRGCSQATTTAAPQSSTAGD